MRNGVEALGDEGRYQNVGLKVALITSWKARCGIATYSANLAKALADQGVEVFIVRLPRFGALTPDLLQAVVDSVPVSEVDLVHVQHEYGLYKNQEGGFYASLKALGKPLVTTMHSTGVLWNVDRVVAATSDRVIVHNQFCLRRFGHPAEIIPHGCSNVESNMPASEAKQKLDIQAEVPIVGYCGFISDYKGLELLIEAVHGLPRTALLIAGGWHVEPGTEYINELKRRSLALLPKRCRWLGYVPDDQLSTVYAAMDLVAYPSRFSTESGALITALSHGKAVIASNLPPFKEKEREGALITFKDVRDLRRKARRLLEDEELRHQLEQGALEYAKRNSWANVARRHIALYEQLMVKSR